MNNRFTIVRLSVVGSFIVCLVSSSSFGQLTLTGGGLTLVEEGPTVANAGDPVPTNLATGATPFASSELGPEIGVAFHVAANLNDGGTETASVGSAATRILLRYHLPALIWES